MATFAQLIERVVQPLDMQDYSILSETEVRQAINTGIKKCEAKIHNIYEDYFLSFANISIAAGVSEYDLPSDIFAMKIRKVLFNDGTKKYEIMPIRDLKIIPVISDNEEYRYKIFNTSSGGVKIKLFPTPTETSATNITIYYIRDAKQLVNISDVCDIPEFDEYIVRYAQVECLKKEMSNPMLQVFREELSVLEGEMIETLSQAIVDENYDLPMDMSFYRDFYNDEDGGL